MGFYLFNLVTVLCSIVLVLREPQHQTHHMAEDSSVPMKVQEVSLKYGG
jgi:hypothetical protein